MVCNFVTVDGRYEDDDHDIVSFFEHQHPDYRGADTFDHYTTSLLAEADTVLVSTVGVVVGMVVPCMKRGGPPPK